MVKLIPILIDIESKRAYQIECQRLFGDHFADFHKSDSRLIQTEFAPSLCGRLDGVFFAQVDRPQIDESLSIDVVTMRLDNFELGIVNGHFFASGNCCLLLRTTNTTSDSSIVLVDLKLGSIDNKIKLQSSSDFEQFKWVEDSTETAYLIAKK